MSEQDHNDNNEPCSCGPCEACSVRAAALFAGVEEEVLRQIQHDIEERRLARGETLYHMEEPGRAIFTVREGLVKLLQYLPDGGERIVRLVRAADVTGLEALVGQVYQHDAVAEQETVVCRIPLDVIRRLEGESPQLYRELMRRWQQALSEADAWMTELGTGSARQRVARLLLRLSDSEGNGLCALFSRRDMGAMLGITTESASRVVAEMKRSGTLRDSAGSFRCERDALEEIASE